MTRLELGQLTVREDAPREVAGYGVRWGSIAQRTPEYGPETFAPGSFRDALKALGGRPVPFLDRHDGEVIGALRAREDADGLVLEGTLFGNPGAFAWAERSGAGIDGASLEFLPDPAGVVVTRDGVSIHKRVARLVAVAASYKPAHQGAALSIRDLETATMIETPTRETRSPEPEPEPKPEPPPEPPPGVTAREVEGIVHREMGELRRGIAEMGGTVRADVWAAVRDIPDLGALVKRVVTERPSDLELRGVLKRALADQLTSESPGVMAPRVINDIKGIVTQSRAAINAFGGPRPLTDAGMTLDWPISATALSTIVGEQVTQKTEVTTVDVPITKGTTPIRTWGGGSDVSYQLIRRSDPSYLDALERIYLAAYALVTDTAFVDALEAASGLGTGVVVWTTATIAQMQTAALNASVKVKDATGEPASFMIAGSAVFVAVGTVLTPTPVQNVLGTAEAATLSITLSGLRVIYHPAVAAGRAIISNERAAGWHEDGPYFATEEDVAKLGRNVAIWGMGAAAVYLPAGVVYTSTT